MDKLAFEQLIKEHGKDILRFCRMTSGSSEEGDELYQDTMLTLYEHIDTLDESRNVKSYAISTALLLWKNKKRKYARRHRIAPFQSMEQLCEGRENTANPDSFIPPPDEIVISKEEIIRVRNAVKALPEKYRLPVYMFYSAGMSIQEISGTLHIPQGTVKTRMQKARMILKEKLT